MAKNFRMPIVICMMGSKKQVVLDQLIDLADRLIEEGYRVDVVMPYREQHFEEITKPSTDPADFVITYIGKDEQAFFIRRMKIFRPDILLMVEDHDIDVDKEVANNPKDTMCTLYKGAKVAKKITVSDDKKGNNNQGEKLFTILQAFLNI